jgi:Type VI secretion system effector, Hcp
MFTKTVRTIAAMTAGISLASAGIPAISQADTTSSGKPTISSISIMKQTDAASPTLYLYAAN